MKKKIVRTIAVVPTLLTLGNAFCGFLALAYVADALGDFGRNPEVGPEVLLKRSAWLIFLGMVFDALDGLIARLARSDSAFGAELDSLCDVITFGVAPAFLVKVLAQRDPSLFSAHPRVALWFCVLFVACAILRLARYNVENIEGRKGPTHFFVGLPTPAAAGVLASLVLIRHSLLHDKAFTGLLGEALAARIADGILHGLPFLLVFLGLLMVSRVPFVHAVNWLTRGRRPFPFVILLIGLLILAVFFTEIVLALAFVGYVVFSLVAFLIPGPWRKGFQIQEQDDLAPE